MLFEEERQQKIADYVQTRERASVQELAQQFQVSESTVRRDLKILEESSQLRRTHGGAVALVNDNSEPPFMEKEDSYRVQKEAIAKAAAAMIQEGDTIVLDSGTTTYYLAKELKAFKQLTVVTNSVMAAQELLTHPGVDLVLTGGSLRHETLAMVGPLTEKALKAVYVDKAFLATNGLDPVIGLTTPNILEASAKQSILRSAKQVILLADHSKFGKVSFAKVAELPEIDHWITDDGLPDNAREELEAAGLSVTVVHAGGRGHEL
ncbi:DeoR/GlpR family DNA-binding transcription regulator [Paenibacillus tyrfis]|uniref:DeoR/GlpR family DNA-binding transcription regulator n=1 Tax=Paenibacillus tyrfis TaxID=1501230 RepID=UPI0020A083BA|nr:DeoR/GlpR family DNA-binding transcription regulator [Paenibacillus tyrfis]MCP1308785.1 DeoR/GlpR family DNA-binding transcription regulator [Paenibacillus tyrfis]